MKKIEKLLPFSRMSDSQKYLYWRMRLAERSKHLFHFCVSLNFIIFPVQANCSSRRGSYVMKAKTSHRIVARTNEISKSLELFSNIKVNTEDASIKLSIFIIIRSLQFSILYGTSSSYSAERVGFDESYYYDMKRVCCWDWSSPTRASANLF